MENSLKQLGLKEYEAKVYLALLKHGKLDAKQVAAFAVVPQNRVYETVESLQRLGFADIFLGVPKKFEAIDPKQAISHYLTLKEQNLQTLRESANQLALNLKKSEPSKPEGGIWSVTGREEISKKRLAIFNLSKKSQKSVVSATRPPEKEYAYKKVFKELKKRHVDTKTIHAIQKLSPEYQKWHDFVKAEKLNVRFVELPLHMKMGIIDSELAYLESTEGPEEQWYLIWTNSKPIVKFLENYFDLLWKKPLNT